MLLLHLAHAPLGVAQHLLLARAQLLHISGRAGGEIDAHALARLLAAQAVAGLAVIEMGEDEIVEAGQRQELASGAMVKPGGGDQAEIIGDLATQPLARAQEPAGRADQLEGKEGDRRGRPRG